MSAQRLTSYAERQRFVHLHQQGHSYRHIAQSTGWKLETVRKQCQAFQQHGAAALAPRPPGPVRRGPLSTFDPIVRWAALRIKCAHRAWGPAVVRDELQHRRSTRRRRVPHVSQLAVYFHQFGSRLVHPRRHVQLPPPLAPASDGEPRLSFQLDIQERLVLPGLGWFNVVEIRAPGWGMTVGCGPHPAGQKRWQRKVSLPEIRDDCRHTFEQWGLPDEICTDREKVLVPSGEYPFPSCFTLWLVGLGIQHTLIQRVTQNGSVERSHRTFDKQVLSGCPAQTWPAFERWVVTQQRRLRERVPSRAWACHGQPPLVAHPEALRPQRPYRIAWEHRLFEMGRVWTYLAHGRWIRRASTHGQFHFADAVWTVGRQHERETIVITLDPDTHEFVVCTLTGEAIKRLPSDWITEAAIRGLPPGALGKKRRVCNSRKQGRIRNYRKRHPNT